MTGRTTRSEMVEEVLEELTTYIRAGTINRNEVARSLGFDGVEIDDFDRLKRIHFTISPGVVRYVRKLPERLRNIKRESERQKNLRRHVDGKIDWNATTKLRYSDNYGDNSVFICDSPHLEYDIPENLVLKKLLWVIYRTITEDVRHIEYSVEFEDEESLKWAEGLISEMESIFERNVHVNRIGEVRDITITGRHLQAARRSRNPLYQQAHDLYKTYDRLMRDEYGESEEEILKDTLITPAQNHRLFEFYTIFKLLRVVREVYEEIELKPVTPASNPIAELEQSNETRIKMFHDDTGDLSLKEHIDEENPAIVARSDFLSRHKEASEDYSELSNQFLGESKNMNLYSGRPDIVMQFEDEGRGLYSVVIGEVKYTRSEYTLSNGLEQLSEYLNYCRLGDVYLDGDSSDVDLYGILITDSVDTRCDRYGSVAHYNSEELSDNVDDLEENPLWLPEYLSKN